MNNFVKGILLGVGIGLLIAPLSGEEARRRIAERAGELRDSLPEASQEYVRRVSGRVSQAGGNLLGYGQQAVSTLKDTGSALGDLAQRSAHEVKSTGQDVIDTTRQIAES